MERSTAKHVSTRAFYDVFLGDKFLGKIVFINHVGRPVWLVESVDDDVPASVSDYSADTAREKLSESGHTLKHAQSKKQYIYV